ncbi:hypothetical protein LAZ67_1003454 [Cordylochernes scorpioides]|uniref:Uncharacterized protein n=1 Tax=Cordylochernes scorpioides TaxID=51811 RepID=A0ABY6JZN5_9ARAC|nr:hypothetical protein LAZ67_1003454 [Cordylochernes scorpioides]
MHMGKPQAHDYSYKVIRPNPNKLIVCDVLVTALLPSSDKRINDISYSLWWWWDPPSWWCCSKPCYHLTVVVAAPVMAHPSLLASIPLVDDEEEHNLDYVVVVSNVRCLHISLSQQCSLSWVCKVLGPCQFSVVVVSNEEPQMSPYISITAMSSILGV